MYRMVPARLCGSGEKKPREANITVLLKIETCCLKGTPMIDISVYFMRTLLSCFLTKEGSVEAGKEQ